MKTVERIADMLTVFGEAYLDDGMSDSSLKLCLGDGEALCSTSVECTLGPDSPLSALSPCQLNEVAQDGEVLSIRSTASEKEMHASFKTPQPLDVFIATERTGEVIKLRAEIPTDATYVLAWVGARDATSTRWNTEENPDALKVIGDTLIVEIPASVVDSCGECKTMLQVARVREAQHGRILSESRHVLGLEAEGSWHLVP